MSGIPTNTSDGIRIRQAAADDLEACGEVWRAGLDAYGPAVGRPPIVAAPGPLLTLLGHLRGTDPAGFLVATRAGRSSGSDRGERPADAGEQADGAPGEPSDVAFEDEGRGSEAERVVAFASAIRRGPVWFLGMLFVHPDEQARGLGRALLRAVLPPSAEGMILATCTDAAQPVSNALYARHGIVPRVPVLELVGRPDRERLPPLASGVRAVPFDVLATGSSDAPGRRHLAGVLDAIDRAALGYTHPEDHAYVAACGRLGYLYEAGDGRVVGYGYTSTVGRVGPVAVDDEALLPGVLGHLLGAVEPAGAFAAWVPGAAGAAVTALLEAGLRIEDYPALLCWDRPFADFSRYLPITLAVP